MVISSHRRRAPNPARFQEQTEQVFKTTVFLSRLEDFAGMNEVYRRHVGEAPPARSTVEVGKFPGGALLEIEAIAHL